MYWTNGVCMLSPRRRGMPWIRQRHPVHGNIHGVGDRLWGCFPSSYQGSLSDCYGSCSVFYGSMLPYKKLQGSSTPRDSGFDGCPNWSCREIKIRTWAATRPFSKKEGGRTL